MTSGDAVGHPVDAVLAVAGDPAGCTVSLTVRGTCGSADRSASAPLGPDLTGLADGSTSSDEFVAVLSRTSRGDERESAGSRLFDGVVRGAVADLWQEVAASHIAGRRLRLRLDVGPQRLRALPWELLRSGSTWLALRQNVVLWRGADPVLPCGDDDGPLRVLIVMCNPLDLGLMGDDELTRVAGALAGQLGRMHVETLDGPAGAPMLAEAVHRLRPHVLHFIGHGMPRAPGSAAELAFNWVPDGVAEDPHRATPWELAGSDIEFLFTNWVPRLVVINACRTATAALDQIGGIAEAFLDTDARAVVSMQADVESKAATLFSAALYEGLADMAPLDHIVAEARRRLRRAAGGDNGEWALPVLATRTDPTDVLRIRFVPDPSSISRLSDSTEYRRLRYFLGRACERRKAWWALDPPPQHDPARSLLVIEGHTVAGSASTGSTWLTRWCLFTYFVRGYRATYVDLGTPLRYDEPGRDRPRTVERKGWLDVIRVIRDASLDPRQPEPLPANAYSRFNAALNDLTVGSRRSEPAPAELPVQDRWLPFDDDVGRADDRRRQIFSEFLTDLSVASDGRPHVIALDHADKILDDEFDEFVYPLLVKPVADGRHAPIRLVLVGPSTWAGRRLPPSDERLWGSVSLGGFAPGEFARLARDFCGRRGLDFESNQMIFKLGAERFPGGVPVTWLDETAKLFAMKSVGP
ncbi:CHAT domain-containing protein [Pseudonocardia broussonetiae]|uniref:CHAT domain-containing protein n=1 Tax=Pseudonocardia broussonetiae TaxID=2736640 RepID=A0A6M6JL00_9PSEU|nr:CHAT domain-containing protein [Pseudonocardia broussonetiae]QJY47945.1 CHAT domain-containing protein [Pseudonocardia broussonetiae]